MTFRLDGCRSLKEKRGRLARLRDRHGRSPNVAVFESGYQDHLDQAEWTFVVAASAPKPVAGMVSRLIDSIEDVDAWVVGLDTEVLD